MHRYSDRGSRPSDPGRIPAAGQGEGTKAVECCGSEGSGVFFDEHGVNDILDIVADAAQLWADPDFELRRQAELLIPAITGYEPDMVRIELKRYMRQFRRRELLRFLDSEIGQPSMLDEFRPNKAGGYSKYVGPALTYQVFSSNVPGIPVWSMAMTLLV